MATDHAPITAETDDRLDPALLKLTAIVLVGVVVVQLDTTIVAVAINTLGRDLHAGLSTIQWVSTGYLLALALVLPLAGWSIERFGAKRMWMISLACFLVGSMLSGVAWSAGALIAFRVLQGIGGGLLIPLGRAVVAQAAGPQRLGRLMAAMGVPLMLAPVLGPVVGGLLLDSVSWRWIFLVNVPVCAAGLLLAWRAMPDQGTQGRHPLDVVGLVLLSPALATIVYGFSEAGHKGGFASGSVVPAGARTKRPRRRAPPGAAGARRHGRPAGGRSAHRPHRSAPDRARRPDARNARDAPVHTGRTRHERTPAGHLPGRPGCWPRRGLRTDAGCVLPRPQWGGDSARHDRRPDRPTDRRVVRHGDARRRPRAPDREPGCGRGVRRRHRLRPHVLVGGRVHGAGARSRPLPAKGCARAHPATRDHPTTRDHRATRHRGGGAGTGPRPDGHFDPSGRPWPDRSSQEAR